MKAAILRARVRAGVGRDEILGLDHGVLVLRVAAPPVDGRANKAVCRLVAKRLGVAPSRVTILAGDRSREKRLRVDGLDQAEVDSALKL